jgi:hypothetical protein
MALTGRFTFRRTMTGKIVLQVEEEYKGGMLGRGAMKRRWRDASLMDMAMPEMRALIDLRYKPQFTLQTYYGTAEAANADQREGATGPAGAEVLGPPNGDAAPRRTAH